MLVINTRNDQLAAALADFSSRGMLHGTCLGEAIQQWKNVAGIDNIDDLDAEDEDEDHFSGPDGNGESGYDLDLDDDDDDGAPGPVDGPSISSEVFLAQRKGSTLALKKLNTLLTVQSSPDIPVHILPSARATHRSSGPW
jgi:hypothetical protein